MALDAESAAQVAKVNERTEKFFLLEQALSKVSWIYSLLQWANASLQAFHLPIVRVVFLLTRPPR